MAKSSKRIRLEKEIFSKSIKDIEKMFNFACDEEYDEPVQRKVSSYSSAPSAVFSRLDVPAGTLRFTNFDYDCINPKLISDTNSESNESVPSSMSQVPAFIAQTTSARNTRDVLLDLNDDEDVEEYEFELDLKQYMPRINLEKDLKMIDTMFSRPVRIRS